MKHLAMALMTLLLTISAVAQNAPASQASILAWSPAKSIGMFVYPTNNQAPYQQMSDESECYGSAKQNTGFDPQAPVPAGPSAQQQEMAQQQAAQQAGRDVRKGQTLIGAGVGAGGGAAIGAIAGNAGEGAAIGAVAGAVAGRIRRRRAEERAKQEAAEQEAQSQQVSQAQTIDQRQAALNSFRRAFAACLGARGYSAD
jgi:outer membrane lipoprotein SlyB